MPKRIFLAFALAALALVACNQNVNDLYGTAPPSASPTPSLTPNPVTTAATVTVTYLGSPVPSQVVTLYSSSAASQTPGPPIVTQTTNPAGQTTFNGLTAAAWYCFATTYTPKTAGALPRTQNACSDIWFAGVDLSF
jgi:hypothetical protein